MDRKFIIYWPATSDTEFVSLYQLRAISLCNSQNFILSLPTTILFKWLASDRLGLFDKTTDRILFRSGLARCDIYQPILGDFKPFELASLLVQMGKCDHFQAITQFMRFRTDYVRLRRLPIDDSSIQFTNSQAFHAFNRRKKARLSLDANIFLNPL